MEGIGLMLATVGALAVGYLTYLYFEGVIDMKKIIVMVLGIVAAMTMCACGQTADPILGTWSIEVMGENASLTFLDNNTVLFESNGETSSTTAEWGKTDDGYVLYSDVGGTSTDININGNKMTVEYLGDGLVFEKE